MYPSSRFVRTSYSDMFSKRIYIVIVLYFLIMASYSCQESVEANPDLIGVNFYPLQTGNFIDYEIQELNYQIVSDSADTIRYQLRELVFDSIAGLDGETTYILRTLRRENAQQPWVVDSVWQVRNDITRVIKTESNVPYIKLSFPLEEGREWDGNALNSFDTTLYRIKDLALPTQINTFTFARSVRVIHQDDSTAVSLKRSNETFVENIGLVYKERIDVSYKTEDESGNNLVGQGVINFGQIYTQKVINFSIQ